VIAHVKAFKLSPVGNVGLETQLVTVPLTLGVTVVIADPIKNSKGLPVYVSPFGEDGNCVVVPPAWLLVADLEPCDENKET
jgi:hypothetical protein